MSPRPRQPPHAEFELPLRSAQRGRFDDAVARTLRHLGAGARHPSRVAAATRTLISVAHLALAAGRGDAAERALDEALALSPGYADLHYERARLHLAGGRRAEARAALEQALRIHPRYLAARLEYALLHAREGRVGEAIELLRPLPREAGLEDLRTFRQGLECLAHGDWDAAESLLQRALRLGDPGLAPHLERARLLCSEQRPGEAARVLRAQLPRYQAYPDLLLQLGEAEFEDGAFDDAAASFARALELHPDFHAARLRLAAALDAVGATAQASDQVALVLQFDPENPEALELHERWSFHGLRAGARATGGRKAS